MSNALVTLLVLLGFAAVAAAFFLLAVRDARKWPRKLEEVLLPMGFRPSTSEADRRMLAERLRIVQPRHQGRRLIKHLYRREEAGGGATLYVCDYHFASAGGKARGGGWTLVCLVSGALALPHFSIDTVPEAAAGMPARVFGALADALPLPPGLQHLPTGVPELDRRLHVLAEPGTSRLPLPDEALRMLATTAGGTSLDAQGDLLVLASVAMLADRVRGLLDPQKLLALMHLAGRLHALLHR